MLWGVVELTALANDWAAVMCTSLLMYVSPESRARALKDTMQAGQSDKRYKRRRKLLQFPAACPRQCVQRQGCRVD